MREHAVSSGVFPIPAGRMLPFSLPSSAGRLASRHCLAAALTRPVALLLIVLFLGGWYGSRVPVISPERSEPIPGLEGCYRSAESRTADIGTIASTPGSNDYKVSEFGSAKFVLNGYRLVDDIFAVQVRSISAPERDVSIIFLGQEDDGDLAMIFPDVDPTILAVQAGANFDPDVPLWPTLMGEPAALLQFIDLHKTADFESAYLRPWLIKVDCQHQ